MISKESIDRIMDAARVEEVVNDYVTLKKRGANYIGLCPFHNEKTPSFNVSPAKGIYKCFGCGKSGNAVGFVMEHEHFTYREALLHLAKRYNIEVEETRRTEEEVQQDHTRESLYIINAFAQNYFSQYLTSTDEGRNIGLSYLKERGLSDSTIEKFKLGYSPSAGNVFTETALQAGYQFEFLRQLGLSSEQRKDAFRGRVIFPIAGISGKVLGFGARTLSADKKVPKYINSPESEVYVKSKVLYGLHQARQAMTVLDECFLVEGYMDVLSLAQAGIEHVVASSGTALTQDQVRLIKRYTRNLTILYDGDQAGIKAALRGLDISLQEGLNVKVMLLPEHEDPDTWVQKLGAQGFLDKVQAEKKDLIHLRTALYLEEAGKDPVRLAEITREIAQSISFIPDPIARSLYTRQAAVAMGVEESVLISVINQLIRKKTAATLSKEDQAAVNAGSETNYQPIQPRSISFHLDEPQEKDIVRLLLENSNYEVEGDNAIVTILRNLEDVDIDHILYKKIIDEYKTYYHQQEFLSQAHFINHEEDSIRELCTNLLQSPYEVSENWTKMHEVMISDKAFLVHQDITKTIGFLKLKKVLKMKSDLEKQLHTLQENKAAETEIILLMKDVMQLNEVIGQLQRLSGIVALPYERKMKPS